MENGLNLQPYLEYVFEQIRLHGSEMAKSLLLWMAEVPKVFRIPLTLVVGYAGCKPVRKRCIW